MDISLLGFGTALMDVIAFVDDSFLLSIPGQKGGTVRIDDVAMQAIIGRLPKAPTLVPGGATANTLAGYARLGGKVSYLAKIGNDDIGHAYAQNIQSEGVDISPFIYDDNVPTGRCLSLITPDSERTMRTFMGANASLTPEELSLDDFRPYTHLFMEGYTFYDRALALRILSLARQAGLVICMDLNSPEIIQNNRDILPDVLKTYVTAVFANELEATTFAQDRNPLTALKRFSELCDISVVKQGKAGAWIQEGHSSPLHMDAVPVANVVDTTGAGDLWAAGFLYGWLNRGSMTEAGRLGAELGAAIVQIPGARLPDKTWETLRRLV